MLRSWSSVFFSESSSQLTCLYRIPRRMNEGKRGEKKNQEINKKKVEKKKEICHHKKKKRSDSKFHARTLLITPAICEKTPRHAKNSDMQEVVLLPDTVDNV